MIDVSKNRKPKKTRDISLYEAVNSFHDEDMLQRSFLCMDRTMHYLHNKGFFVESFDPNSIYFLNGNMNEIRFKDIDPFPKEIDKREIIKEDIFLASYLHVSLYGKFSSLNREYLRNNFDEFTFCLPENMIPYYKGIIQRGATVYLEEYLNRMQDEQARNLSSEIGGISNNRQYVKSNGHNLNNDSINDAIYSETMLKEKNSKWSSAAFLRLMMIPIILMIFIGLFLSILLFCF